MTNDFEQKYSFIKCVERISPTWKRIQYFVWIIAWKFMSSKQCSHLPSIVMANNNHGYLWKMNLLA